MKKIVAILILVTSLIGIKASDPSISLDLNQGYTKYTGLASDTCGIGDTVQYITINPNKLDRLFYDIAITLTKVSGTGVNRTILQARKFSGDTWTNIATVRSWGTQTDTTGKFSQVSTAQFYREYRLQISKTSGTLKTKIKDAEFIFKK